MKLGNMRISMNHKQIHFGAEFAIEEGKMQDIEQNGGSKRARYNKLQFFVLLKIGCKEGMYQYTPQGYSANLTGLSHKCISYLY